MQVALMRRYTFPVMSKVTGIDKKQRKRNETAPKPRVFRNAYKTIYVELFFDLVFVFCMNNILPIMTNAAEPTITWYTFYTFSFTSLLLLQIWFDVTIFMNRFGTGGVLDLPFLIVNAFLLIIMSQTISTGWEHYRVYNGCWILILLNCILHWFIRYKLMLKSSKRYRHLVCRTMGIMGLQALLVLIGTFSGSFWGQVIALVAVITGFFSWSGRDARFMNSSHYHHLAERCALVMVMMFGENLVEMGTYSGARDHMLTGLLYLLMITMMFLIYIVEYNRALDYRKLRNGLGLMAITTWQTYVLAVCTVAFDLMINGKDLWLMNSSHFFSLSIAVFLLSFFFYMPFNRSGHFPNKRVVIGRLSLCLACLVFSRATISGLTSYFLSSSGISITESQLNGAIFLAATSMSFLLVLAVLILDWKNYECPVSELTVDPYAPPQPNSQDPAEPALAADADEQAAQEASGSPSDDAPGANVESPR